jgi:hypothetical protein
MRAAADAARDVLRRYPDALSLEAVEAYFRRIYWVRRNGLDDPRILSKLNERANDLLFPFEEAATEVVSLVALVEKR